ncbi:MAG: tRNA-dihydrouridine synthase [Planctomycetota bacterium]
MHHIDMNFGCPVRKVTAAGGGAPIQCANSRSGRSRRPQANR